MTRACVGECYSLVNPASYEPRKRGGGKHERLYSYMMPSLGATGIPLILGGPRGRDFYRACVSTFYQFVDLVARLPVEARWNALFLDDDCWRVMDDFHLAEALLLELREWRAQGLALCGAGVLQKRTLFLDVGEDQAVRYELARQRERQLPLFQAVAPIDSFDSFGPSRTTNRRNENERRNETKRNERRGPPVNSGPHTTREPAGEARPSGHVSPETPEAEGPEGWLSSCRSLVLSSNSGAACKLFGKLLEHWLCVDKPATDRDRQQWSTIFGRVWTLPGERYHPTPEERAARIGDAAAQALEASFRGDLESRPAYFAAWAKRMGFLKGSGWRESSSTMRER